MLTFDTMKTIQVSDEFHSYLASHGQFGDTMEAILTRLIGVDKLKAFTGDKVRKIYKKDDVDTRATKKARSLSTGREK